MLGEDLKRALIPSGPILSLALIGILLLSGLLYYRAVRVQRFLEPALALTQPRIEFDAKLVEMLGKELSPEDYGVVQYQLNSIHVREEALRGERATRVLTALGRVFVALIEDDEMRPQISIVVVSTKAELGPDFATHGEIRQRRQDDAEALLTALYEAEPKLKHDFPLYFEATAKPVVRGRPDAGWMSFRLVPSEKLHVDVLQKLNKYVE